MITHIRTLLIVIVAIVIAVLFSCMEAPAQEMTQAEYKAHRAQVEAERKAERIAKRDKRRNDRANLAYDLAINKHARHAYVISVTEAAKANRVAAASARLGQLAPKTYQPPAVRGRRSDCVNVKAYVKRDGTRVRAHTRRKPR